MRQLLAVLLVIGLLAGVGCGSKTVTDTSPNGQVTTSTVPDVKFPKTKFLLHSGFAFGAFHRYILNPYQAHKFDKGANGRKRAFVKAGVAGLFGYHELKQARDAALSSDVLRRKVIAPLDTLLAKLKDLAAAMKGGNLNPAALLSAGSALDAFKSASAGAGADIKDRNAPIPGI
jgi:hypothetical protein